MSFNRFLKKIDLMICSYIGLEREELSAKTVQLIVNELVVVHTSSFKRHAVSLSWKDFTCLGGKESTEASLEKLGAAAGKAIAKQLVVTFKEAKLKTG
ncbi:MAG: hypothetical protein ACHQAX_04975 [Gammaproteobacteria bacterium]